MATASWHVSRVTLHRLKHPRSFDPLVSDEFDGRSGLGAVIGPLNRAVVKGTRRRESSCGSAAGGTKLMALPPNRSSISQQFEENPCLNGHFSAD